MASPLTKELFSRCVERSPADSPEVARVRKVLDSIDSAMAATAFGQYTATNRPQPPLGNPWNDAYAANHMMEWARTVARRARERRALQAARTANPWPFGAEGVRAHGSLPGDSGMMRPEPELLGTAVLLANFIKLTYAARSGMVNGPMLVGQVDDTVHATSHQCHRIWFLRTTIERPESNSDVARALNQAINERLSRVGRNWDELLENVSRLADLAGQCSHYSEMLRDSERHQRLLAHYDNAGADTGAHRAEALDAMNGNLAAQIEFINDTARRVANTLL